VGTTHNNVRMSKEEVLEGVLKSKKGALNPFALVNDKEHHVKKLIIEEKLFNSDHWAFHPMDNSATVELSQEHFLQFLAHFQVPFERLDLLEQVEEKKEEKAEKKGGEKKGEKGEKEKEVNLLGIEAKKSADFSGWYQEVIVKSGLIDYYDVSGCYILRPWAYSIWEKIQAFFDKLIKANGVENAYFPMFVSRKSLEIEKDHV
jgi:prolyl-tRNA synthetase